MDDTRNLNTQVARYLRVVLNMVSGRIFSLMLNRFANKHII
jgi:hypothetical protein